MENILKKIDAVLSHKSFTNESDNVVGYFCSYVPEEILTAAGLTPFRMKAIGSAGAGTDLADAFYSTKNCTFPRNILNKYLHGEFDFLSGMIFMNCCDTSRRMHDHLRHMPKKYERFLHFLDVPHMTGQLQLEAYVRNLTKMISDLEACFGVKISEEGLLAAAKLHNKKRALIRKINELRQQKPSPVKGSTMLQLMLAITSVKVEEAITLLEEFLIAVQSGGGQAHDGVRLYIAGACFEDVAHFKMIEELGGSIIVDNTCLGFRYADPHVDESKPILASIAEAYLNHLSCARMTNCMKQRLDFVEKSMADYAIAGAIYEKLSFCVLYGGESFVYRRESQRLNYPLLLLEREYADQAVGQIKTRVQAFIEMIKNRE